MKYTILINQRTLAERFPTLNLKDAALLAFMADVFASPRLQFRDIDGHRYHWAKYTWIAKEMPLCGFTTADAVSRRMRRLREVGLLETIVVDGTHAMHRPGPRWDELSGLEPVGDHPPGMKTSHPPDEKEAPPGWKRGTPPDEKEAPLYRGLDHGDKTIKTNPASGVVSKEIPKKPAASPRKVASKDHEALHHYPAEFQADETFKQALADYFQARREKRSPATPTSARMLVKRLTIAGLASATKALQTSAANGWTGVFPENEPAKLQTGSTEPEMKLW